MITYFERKLRLKDSEVWDIHCGKKVYRMFILDEHRPPTLLDLNLPDNGIEEEVRQNLITVSVYSECGINEEHIECLDQLSKQLTDHVALAHCDVIMDFYTGKIDTALHDFLEEKQGLNYEGIPLAQLWHFNQN